MLPASLHHVFHMLATCGIQHVGDMLSSTCCQYDNAKFSTCCRHVEFNMWATSTCWRHVELNMLSTCCPPVGGTLNSTCWRHDEFHMLSSTCCWYDSTTFSPCWRYVEFNMSVSTYVFSFITDNMISTCWQHVGFE